MAQEEEIRYFVRVGTTDLDGTKSVRVALTGIKGVGRHTSSVISRMAKVDEYASLGRLDEDSVNRLRTAVEQYSGKIPSWMANRPKDVYTGEAKHLLGPDVALAKDEDVNLMRKIAATGASGTRPARKSAGSAPSRPAGPVRPLA